MNIIASFEIFLLQAQDYLWHQVLTWPMAIQLGIVGLALLLAHKATGTIHFWVYRKKVQDPEFKESYDVLPFLRVIEPMFTLIFIWIAQRTAHHFDWPREVLNATLIASIALVFIRLFIAQMKNRFWARILMAYLWLWALLYIFHVMDPWIKYLNHIDFQLGQVQLSLLAIYRACFLSFILYWLSRNLLTIWRFWLTKRSDFAPALQVLLYKLGSIFLFSLSGVTVLHYLGLDFTVFALFGGALGLGLGFGLQKVFANLISGFILLADKSIKPGDVIQLKETYGWINYLGSRYISVISRNGTEHLIPNENLVTGEVINWSYSNNLVRLKLPVGISYNSDLEKARDLMLEIAAVTERVLKEPKPSCRLLAFGDSAITLELRVWINDPREGITSVKSDLNWGIWQRFRANDIELPFPQRDLNLKSIPEIRIQTKGEAG